MPAGYKLCGHVGPDGLSCIYGEGHAGYHYARRGNPEQGAAIERAKVEARHEALTEAARFCFFTARAIEKVAEKDEDTAPGGRLAEQVAAGVMALDNAAEGLMARRSMQAHEGFEMPS